MSTETRSRSAGGAVTGDGAGRHPRARQGPYALVIGAYALATGAFLAWCRASGRVLPERFEARDLAMIGVATHKTSRLVSKDKVSTPIRAPFTRLEREEGSAEVKERPSGTGLRRTIGELLACPYCLDMWLATGYSAGLVAAPRVTRFTAGAMSAVAIADLLQMAYRATEERI
jgi:hypothetical protein